MMLCANCNGEVTPSKKHPKPKFCSQKCRGQYWYRANKQKTIDRAASWRSENPEKMQECRQNWLDKNGITAGQYSVNRKSETVEIALEMIRKAEDQKRQADEMIELALDILDMNIPNPPCILESWLAERLDE